MFGSTAYTYATKSEYAASPQPTAADLRREREDLLLVADEVVASVRHEHAEHPPVDERQREDKRGERQSARERAPNDRAETLPLDRAEGAVRHDKAHADRDEP